MAAVGECGLDGPSVEAGAPLARQLAVLGGHFALACKHTLPLLVHDALQATCASSPRCGTLVVWTALTIQLASFASTKKVRTAMCAA